MTQQVDREIAESDFERILTAARVKWDKYKRRAPEDAEFDREDIIDAIIEGTIVVGENGFPTVYPDTENEKVKELKFNRRLYGKDLTASSRCKDEDRKMFFNLGNLFGVAPSEIEHSVDTGDLKLLVALWGIFLRM